ncbi:TEL1S.2 [Arabidopsis thaliana]|uniref:TEL1S.2 n=1 Tax=Arabidopsis thaliana TaxID=3702 RepID=Q9LM11_ARATH|nr:TEL1S.2 [Arabidopsis thaliana]
MYSPIPPSLFQQIQPAYCGQEFILLRDNEEYKEIIVQAGRTYEISLMVESENSYIAWDFSLTQGKITMVIIFKTKYVTVNHLIAFSDD